MRIILASASPRRKELLRQAGFDFEIFPASDKEESSKEKPEEIVIDLAYHKALEVYNKSGGDDTLIIGSDTIVVYQGEVLGKPEDTDDAFNTISMLQDRTHEVYTGVAILYAKSCKLSKKLFYEKTDVTLYPIDKIDISAYISTGDSMDKAGAYGIQGLFARHVKEIRGEYNNVVGLPIGRLYNEMLSLKLI